MMISLLLRNDLDIENIRQALEDGSLNVIS